MNINILANTPVTVNWIEAEGYAYTLHPPTTTQPATLPSQPVVYTFADLMQKVSDWIRPFEKRTVLNIRFSDETPEAIIIEFMLRLFRYMKMFQNTSLSTVEREDKRVVIIR